MLDKLWGFIDSIWQSLLNIFHWLLDTVLGILFDVFFYMLDLTFDIIMFFVNSIDLSELSILETFDSWNLLPTQCIWLLDYLNFPQCLAIIAGAYLIRLLLNIIPAALTRI